jgi:hypothetical protein
VPLDITRLRLRNQRLSGTRFSKPEEVVSWLGAVQAQDYADTRWALALRMRRAAGAAIERAIADGRILRTHVMRPTWHFVTAEDIRWMLALTAHRVSARMAPYNRRLELNAALFRRSQSAIVKALRGGAQLTRQELKAVLQRAGVRADSVQRLAHIAMQAELDAVICSGVHRGNQCTYALLDERVPASRTLSRDDALAELTRRYIRSHGPAQLHDFVWWSGLTAGDARSGLAMLEPELDREVVDGKTYWFYPGGVTRGTERSAYLLGLYDEYLIAYKDRSDALDRDRWTRAVRDPFSAPIVIDGQVVGGWRRFVKGSRMVVKLMPFERFNRKDAAAVHETARAYAAFFGLDVETVLS